jgi:hypothetical protein
VKFRRQNRADQLARPMRGAPRTGAKAMKNKAKDKDHKAAETIIAGM